MNLLQNKYLHKEIHSFLILRSRASLNLYSVQNSNNANMINKPSMKHQGLIEYLLSYCVLFAQDMFFCNWVGNTSYFIFAFTSGDDYSLNQVIEQYVFES